MTTNYFQRSAKRTRMTHEESRMCDEALKRLKLAGFVRDDSTPNSVETKHDGREPGQSQKGKT